MFNSIASVQQAAPERLARLVSINETGEETWAAGELREMLHHQLTAPLATGLQGLLPEAKARCYADLLREKAAPVPLLRQARDYAKRQCLVPGTELPREVALVLYYAFIAAAEAHAHAHISSLNQADLVQGWQWARDLTWLDEETRQLFIEALCSAGTN